MHPEFELQVLGHSITLQSYGLSISLGALAWLILVARETSRRGLESMRARLGWLLMAMIAAGWVGGKALHVLANDSSFEQLLESPGAGFVFYGSLLTAIPVFVFLARRLGVGPAVALDVVLAPAPLLHVFGRCGCFLAGCCYGLPCDRPWAVTFREGRGLNGMPLHPVQLYEAVGELALFAVIWFWLRPRASFPGQIALSYLIGYSVLRLVTEQFRGDSAIGDSTSASTGVLISTMLLGACVGLWSWARSRSRSTAA